MGHSAVADSIIMFRTITESRNYDRTRSRLLFFLFIILAAFFIIIFKLITIQIINGNDYYQKSQRIIRKIVTFSAPRGEIFDRHYLSREKSNRMVSNAIRLSLVVIPNHFEKNELLEKSRLLEIVLGVKPGSITERVTDVNLRSNDEIVILDNIDFIEISKISDYYLLFSKFIVKQSALRQYLLGEAAAHITGYIGPPDTRDLQAGIKSTNWVGKNGIEKSYDETLRGDDGEVVQLKTGTSDNVEPHVFKNFTPGNNLILTVDAEMQQIAWDSLGDKVGAIIALKPDSGEIMALVSKPSFNPNILIGNDTELRDKHLKYIHENFSELNRAISAKYPPASTFKPLVALTAIEEKQIPSGKSYYCSGKFVVKSQYANLPDSTFHCWSTHADNNLISALAVSCSSYFYQLGLDLGVEPIIRYSGYFKLNSLTGIDIPGEIPGFVPTTAWKEKQYNQRWFDGDTINLSIGQGFLETTLIGMMNFYSAIVTGGIVYQPHLVKEIHFADTDEVRDKISPKVLFELPINQNTLSTIRSGLKKVVQDGTATKILNRPYLVPIAGKTGTVQTRSNDRFANKTQHAWFIGYGPADGDPDKVLLVGVFVEKGIGGAIGAAPVAHDIFSSWSQRIKKGKLLD